MARGEPLILKTIDEMAAIVGVRARQMQTYLADGCPGEKGNYPVAEIVKWVRDNVWVKPAKSLEGLTKEMLEIRRLAIQVETQKLKYGLAAGSLVERRVALSQLEAMINIIRSRLQAVPDEVAALLPEEFRTDSRIDVKQRVELILREMEAWREDQSRSSSPTNSLPTSGNGSPTSRERTTSPKRGTPARRSRRSS